MTYCIYYITLKVIHKERFGVKPLLFGVLGACCWAPALYFYNVKQRTTNATPALSRNMNQDCSMLNLFDYHDIWHFFSAGKYIKERLKRSPFGLPTTQPNYPILYGVSVKFRSIII